LILYILLCSLQNPQVDWASFDVKINLRPPEDVACLAEALPNDAKIWFFSNLDGSTDLAHYSWPYIYATYFLAPRIVMCEQFNKTNIPPFEWLIAYDMGQESLDQFVAQNQATVTKTCDRYTLIHRAASQ
jgi:hypothetical protein